MELYGVCTLGIKIIDMVLLGSKHVCMSSAMLVCLVSDVWGDIRSDGLRFSCWDLESDKRRRAWHGPVAWPLKNLINLSSSRSTIKYLPCVNERGTVLNYVQSLTHTPQYKPISSEVQSTEYIDLYRCERAAEGQWVGQRVCINFSRNSFSMGTFFTSTSGVKFWRSRYGCGIESRPKIGVTAYVWTLLPSTYIWPNL